MGLQRVRHDLVTEQQCVCVCVCVCVCACTCACAQLLNCVQFFATTWTPACKGPLSMKFSRQEYWSELPFSTGNLPHPGIRMESPALAGGFFTTSNTWEAYLSIYIHTAVSSFLRPYRLLAFPAPLYMGFFRQEYWSGLPCPSPYICVIYIYIYIYICNIFIYFNNLTKFKLLK